MKGFLCKGIELNCAIFVPAYHQYRRYKIKPRCGIELVFGVMPFHQVQGEKYP